MLSKNFGEIVATARPVLTGQLTVLVVDDSRAQRRMLSLWLARWGYHVVEADCAETALDLCRVTTFDIVISDWVMPGQSGLDLCRAFRDLPHKTYGYFILLTSNSDKEDVTSGLDGGADDFLTKPVSADELRARLRAGERIIGMQAELVEKNRLIGDALHQLQKVYDSLDRDLIEARKLQQTLVRERSRDFGPAEVALLLRPSGHVGGDLVGFFPITDQRIGFYALDVSGHGVASAMMTARLAGVLSGTSPEQNIALCYAATGLHDAYSPTEVAARLNRMMLDEMKVDQYFTLCYADINLATGQMALVQAGHPHPLIRRASGQLDVLGGGGLPIGLFDGAQHDLVQDRLFPGDRLFLMSDGVTECPGLQGCDFGIDGMRRFIDGHARLGVQPFLDALVWHLNDHIGGVDFPDDVSGLVLHYRGSAQ